MSVSLFFGILTLAPALAGLLIAALGVARRATKPATLGVGVIGALVPLVCLAVLAPVVSSVAPLQVSWAGTPASGGPWLAPMFRIDAFGFYAAAGLALFATPLLFWLAWPPVTAAQLEAAPEDAQIEAEEMSTSPDGAARASRATTARWGGTALLLAIESAGLMLCFSDNILWAGLCWVALVVGTWGIGELGNEATILDRRGLLVMVSGPILTILVLLLVAAPAHAPRFFDLIGRGSVSSWQVALLAVTLALAGGGYPFISWVRRRVAFATPAGIGAVVLLALPAALFVGARCYGALATTQNLWPQFGAASPPLTAGLAFVVLGAATLCACGVLAVSRRDARALLGLLAAAQVGWGLIALGIGQPGSLLGLVLLLATMLLGVGAMLTSAVAGGTIAAEIEIDGAGPQAFGAARSPLGLLAWGIGACTLVAVPFFPGFVARQLIAAAAVHAMRLALPFAGLAWAGDVLLALAVLRALAPAFTGWTVSTETVRPLTLTAAMEDDEPADDDALASDSDAMPRANSWPWRETPGMICALLAVLLGIAPGLLFAHGVTRAASDLLQSNALSSTFTLSQTGYAFAGSQWLPGLAWLAALVVASVLWIAARNARRRAIPEEDVAIVATDDTLEAVATETANAATSDEAEGELATLASPADAWADLGAIRSWQALDPLAPWLLDGVEDDDTADGAEAGEGTSGTIPAFIAASDVTDPDDDEVASRPGSGNGTRDEKGGHRE